MVLHGPLALIRATLRRSPRLWRTLHALRDALIHRRMSRAGSYAQHGEDVELLALLTAAGARGAYVDVGCNHPFRLSNTYLLYRHGWRGLCVDPLPRFRELYARWRPADAFECVGVDERPSQLPLYEFAMDMLSTTRADIAERYRQQGYELLGRTEIEVVPIDALLTRHGIAPPLSLLSLDVEGQELAALRSMDLEAWRPAYVCMEALTADGGHNTDAIDHLLAQGYAERLRTACNIVFERRGL